jgi:hypothetical protein
MGRGKMVEEYDEREVEKGISWHGSRKVMKELRRKGRGEGSGSEERNIQAQEPEEMGCGRQSRIFRD